MRYTVTWKPEAERKLTHLWTSQEQRKEITVAVHEIDQSLRNDPDQLGESLGSIPWIVSLTY